MPFLPILLFLFSLNIFATPSEFNLKSAKSLYIIDGDSVSLKMRIYGIDTPEMKQKCRKNKDKIINCGIIAKNHLTKLLKNIKGKTKIKVITIDDYNRLLVSIHKGNIDIAKTMVRDGFAYAYGSKYKNDEKYAKKNKLGFWGYYSPPMKPKIWRKKYM